MKGFPGATHKKFKSVAEANQWLATHGVTADTLAAPPPVASSSTAKPARPSPIARPQKPEGSKTQGRVKPGNGSLLGKDVIQDTTGWLVVYSDGACKGNGKYGAVAGVGVWWGPDDTRFVLWNVIIFQ